MSHSCRTLSVLWLFNTINSRILNLWSQLSVWKAAVSVIQKTLLNPMVKLSLQLNTDYSHVCVRSHSQVSILSSKRSMNIGIFLKQFKRWVSVSYIKVWRVLHNPLVILHCKTPQDEAHRLVCNTTASYSQMFESQQVLTGLICTVLQLRQVTYLSNL